MESWHQIATDKSKKFRSKRRAQFGNQLYIVQTTVGGSNTTLMRQHPELGQAHRARVDKRTPRSRRLSTSCVTWPRRLPSSSSPWPPCDKAASVTRSERNGDTSTPDDEGNVVSPRSSEWLHCTLVCPPLTICMNRTPTQTACTDAHSVSQHILNSMITFHHANTRGSRLHIFVSQSSGHPPVMSRSLPHLTLTTSTSSLSPTSPIFPTFSPSHPNPLTHDPYLPCEDPRQSGGSTQIPSLTILRRPHF